MPKSTKEDRELRANLRRQATHLFRRFLSRAEQREISQVIGMLHFWVAEEATLLPEDRAEMDILGRAMNMSEDWPGVTGPEPGPAEAQVVRLPRVAAA